MASPNNTLYIRNLEEKVDIPRLTTELQAIFGEFGSILDIVAKKNIRAKGQAFVAFGDIQDAVEAKEALQGFVLFDRPMEISFARTSSDASVKQRTGEDSPEFAQHKEQRLAAKERKKAQLESEAAAKATKRAATDNLSERPAKVSKALPGSAAADEYLPPNKILLLRELPDDYGKPELEAIFKRFPGFKEVRVVPGRKGIAFAEYEDETGSAAARDAMNGVQLGEKNIRVTFQRS